MTADINAVYRQYASGDGTPLEDVIKSGAGIVRYFALHYGGGLDSDDLFQTGMVGLLRAAKSYDAGRGASFSTWASACILSEIRHYARHERACMRAPIESESSANEESPAWQAGFLSLSAADADGEHGGQPFHLAVEDKLALEQALKELGSLQQSVVDALFFRGLTQQQVADELGLTQRRVSRLKCAAMSLLRQLLDPASFHLVENKNSFHYINSKKQT